MNVSGRGTAPKRRFSGTWTTLSTLLRKKRQMSEGRRSQVVLLDERRLDIVIQSRLYAGELLDIVASHFNLKEKEYFGISYIDDNGQHSWLHLDKRVLEHDFPKKSSTQGATLTLYFRIKYFVESITQLRDSATIEAFYLQTKSLIAKGELEIDSEIVFQLAALVIQATYGDYTDDQIFKSHLKRLPVLPTSTLKEFPSIAVCETQVLEHYKVLVGQSRGAAIVNYLSIVESLPTYGQHYYEIKDKTGNPCWLSLSYRGISQYDRNDRRTPRRVFLWKQLENLYFRDKKFTVEVHEARRVVHTLSSFNLYEDAIEEPVEEFDDLSNAICDPTTQVSVSRRALAPASVTVYVWYAASQNIAKCIWSMAIAQHQFFLDRNHKKVNTKVNRSLSQIATELCRSVQSLSSASSHSNISRSTSSASLPTIIVEGELSEESKAATIEMLAALQSRKDALQDTLKKKNAELKALCLKEGEITGELPPETPFQPGEAQPQVRRRIGTSFTISDKVFYKAKSKDRETINNLELDYEIQSKIASAAFKLAHDITARKSVRKIRKVSYLQATSKLKDIEEKLCTLKREKDHKKDKIGEDLLKDKTLSPFALPNSISEKSISARSKSSLINSSVLPSVSLPHLSESSSSSAPSSPSKCRQRHQSLQHVPIVTDDVYEDVLPFEVPTRRNSSSYSAASEYDAISCGGSSIASLGISPYRNRFEANLDLDGTNHYSVPNRRASQVFTDHQTDLVLESRNQDAISQCSEISPHHRYLNTPLSCSYDEQLSYNNSNYDSTSIDSAGTFAHTESYCLPSNMTSRCEKFNHSYSEHSLHRANSGSLHHKLSQVHISEPDLNAENFDMVDGIRHVYSVPTIRNPLLSLSSSTGTNTSIHDHISSISNQSINQVVDLVQASVLLQDCKRAISSGSLESGGPKTKTKEWTETSLDSPILTKKRKNKESVSASLKVEPSQATEWFENGLPTLHNQLDGTYNPQHAYYDEEHGFSQSSCDVRKSPSPLLLKGCGKADYMNMSTPSLYQPHVPYERPQSSRSYNFADGNQYHHYENVAELSNASHTLPVSQSRTAYENVPGKLHYDYENIKEISNTSNSEDHEGAGLSIAQPQEPSKHPARRVIADILVSGDVADTNGQNFYLAPVHDTYEPVVYHDAPHRSMQPQISHCDTFQYSHSYHSESLSPEHSAAPALDTQNNPLVQSWKNFPVSPLKSEDAPLSPVSSQAMNFSPTVEVNVVSVGHFQPYWEETKPYEISDFYKYSTKHKRQQKPNMNEIHEQQNTEECNSPPMPSHVQENSRTVGIQPSHFGPKVSIGATLNQYQEYTTGNVQKLDNAEILDGSSHYYENSPVTLRHPEEPDKSLSLGEMELRISLADTFHDEMVAWYQNQDSAKKATLV